MTDTLLHIALGNLVVTTLLAGIAWCVSRRATRPALGHALWLLVLLKLVTPPLLSIPLLPTAPSTPVALPPSVLIANGPTPFASQPGPGDVRPPATTNAGVSMRVADVLLLVWGTGSVIVLCWSLVHVVRFNKLVLSASSPAPQRVRAAAGVISHRLGLRTCPEVLTTHARLSPLVWWVGGRVRILIPVSLLETLDADALRWILAHELAHVKRRDHAVRWVEWLACVICWWNPITWIARRQLRLNEEVCCDTLVLREFNGRPQEYAGALIKVVEFLTNHTLRPPAIASEITSGGTLERRFRTMLHSTSSTTPRWLTASVLLIGAAALPLGVGGANAEPLAPHTHDDTPERTRIDSTIPIDELTISATFDRLIADLREQGADAETIASLEPVLKGVLHQLDTDERDRPDTRTVRESLVRTGLTGEQADWAQNWAPTYLQIMRRSLEQHQRAVNEHVAKFERRLEGVQQEKAEIIEQLRAEHLRRELLVLETELDRLVHEGTVTRAQADQQITAFRARMSALLHIHGAAEKQEGMERALIDAGIPRTQLDGVMGAVERIVAEMQSEGDTFELDPAMTTWFAEDGFTHEQIALIVGLAEHLASTPHDDEAHAESDPRSEIVMMIRQIETAIASGRVSHEDAKYRLNALRARLDTFSTR